MIIMFLNYLSLLYAFFTDNKEGLAVDSNEEESVSGSSAEESSEGEEPANEEEELSNEGEESSDGEQKGSYTHPRGKKKGGMSVHRVGPLWCLAPGHWPFSVHFFEMTAQMSACTALLAGQQELKERHDGKSVYWPLR